MTRGPKNKFLSLDSFDPLVLLTSTLTIVKYKLRLSHTFTVFLTQHTTHKFWQGKH